MRTKASLIFGALLLMCTATSVWAVSYPPGTPGGVCNGTPGGAGCPYPDTLILVKYIQDATAIPHPVQPDTVYGIAGIITGFDTFPTGFGFYIQNSQGGPWSGVDVFTGGTNYVTHTTPDSLYRGLLVGDSVVTYGRLEEFQGGLELRGFAASAFNNPLPAVRLISRGNALPKFFRGTVNDLQELPTNVLAEPYEGTLVRASANQNKMRVVRTSLQPPGIGTFSSFIVVDNTICPNGSLGPCDSLFIDGSTMSFTAVTPLPLAALIDSVQGIYEQRTRGYRIQLRNSNDLFDSSPPSLTDAYFIHADTIRAVFDRNLTQASAEDENNWTIASSLGPPDVAIRQVTTNIVHLKVATGQSPGDAQGITVNGVVNSANNQAMTSAGNRTMFEGIVPITQVQAPDPVALGTCLDRSLYAGAGSTNGDRITIRGVAVTSYGSTFFLQTAGGGTRSGLQLFAPIASLTPGRQYILAGNIVEFFGETQFTSNVFVRDEGAVAVPAAATQTIAVLQDTTCDASQSILNSEDYEGMLVKVVDVKITEERNAGQSFGVAGPYPTLTDTILIDNNMTRTFDPNQGYYVTVTGVLEVASTLFAGSPWRIQPRNDADIVVNPTLGVDPKVPAAITFAVAPNPSRSPRVTFTLPKRDHVNISVYDLAGRRLAVLADGEYPAERHFVDWNGLDQEGNPVHTGVYFYKMKIGAETFERRGVLIN